MTGPYSIEKDLRRVRKGIYYFPSYSAAHAHAVEGAWPTDRIISYDLGWVIQTQTSGDYVGPSSIGNRRHLELTTKSAIAKIGGVA